jgi:DAK2 domain fusion protein YloV
LLEVLDASDVRRWCLAGRDALLAAREELDALNVFPVPDGDTGANLLATMEAVVIAVAKAPDDLAAVARAISHGSLMGARGNSGVILSQLLRGMCVVWAPLEHIDAAHLRESLVQGASSAYAAVATPVEGTILTVARVAAESAFGSTLAEVANNASAGGATALAQTPDLLPVLREAGVVDSAGRGWCLLLEALEHLVAGTTHEVVARPVLLAAVTGTAARETGSEEYGYEVVLLLQGADDAALADLRSVLGGLGDSLVVVGHDGLHKVHVHVNDVDAVLAAADRAGQTSQVEITRFADQISATGS